MSWANIRELIFHERKVLGTVAPPEFFRQSAFEALHSPLLAGYLETKSSVDAAIRQFAQRLEWPELSEVERFFIAARLEYAWEIVSVMNTSHDREQIIEFPSPEKSKTAEILEWLLIDIWPYGCGRFLQAQKRIAEEPERRGRNAPGSVSFTPFSCLA
jgi:hypothetical protein